MNEEHRCWECNEVIAPERVEFLIESGVHPKKLTCIKHSNATKIKGIYSGEVGTSEIIFCDKVYDDSVKSKFIEIEDEIEDPVDDVDL